jgi:hypothetical protein
MTELTTNQIKSTSTHVDTSVLWSTLMTTADDPLTGKWVDPLTLSMTNLLDLAKNSTPYAYTGKDKITTISYMFYGTTSMWAILLYVNGYMHPDEIPSGAVLNIPAKTDIQAILLTSTKTESSYGKIFTI